MNAIGSSTRQALAARIASALYPEEDESGNVVDPYGDSLRYNRADAVRALAEMAPNRTLELLAEDLPGLPESGVSALIAECAYTYLTDILVVSGVLARAFEPDSSRSLQVLDNALVFADVMEAAGPREGGWSVYELMLLERLWSLGKGRETGWNEDRSGVLQRDWLTASEDEREEAMARAFLGLLPIEWDDKPGPELVAFVRSNLHRLAMLAAVSEERDTIDPVVLAEVLDCPAPSLSAGSL